MNQVKQILKQKVKYIQSFFEMLFLLPEDIGGLDDALGGTGHEGGLDEFHDPGSKGAIGFEVEAEGPAYTALGETGAEFPGPPR